MFKCINLYLESSFSFLAVCDRSLRLRFTWTDCHGPVEGRSKPAQRRSSRSKPQQAVAAVALFTYTVRHSGHSSFRPKCLKSAFGIPAIRHSGLFPIIYANHFVLNIVLKWSYYGSCSSLCSCIIFVLTIIVDISCSLCNKYK